jgi:hypothetical protein
MYGFGNSQAAPRSSIICEMVDRTENLLDITHAFHSSLQLVLTRLLFLKYLLGMLEIMAKVTRVVLHVKCLLHLPDYDKNLSDYTKFPKIHQN